MPLDVLFNPILKATTALGVPVPLAKAYFWAAGGVSVAQNTYADAGQISANANPVIADANGLFPSIYLLPLAYRVVIKDPTDTITYFDEDNIAGGNFNQLFDNLWILKDNIDPTKKMQFQLSSIAIATTRTLTVPDSTGTLLLSTNAIMGAGTLQLHRSSDKVAANDITIPTDGNFIVITGNTQINRLSSPATFQDGTEITLFFSGTPTVKHNQGAGGGFYPILLNGSADFVAASQMVLKLVLVASNYWIEIPRRS